MRKDDQIKAVLNIKKDVAINSGWVIECEEDQVRTYLEWNLREACDEPFEDSLRQIFSAYDYGFSITEPIFALDAGKYKLKSLRTRPPHSFRFDIDDYGDITTLTQSGTKGDQQLDIKKLIHYVYQPEFCNPFGTSDLLSAHSAWKMKLYTIRFMAIYLERFAGPTVVGKYAPNMDQDQINRLFNMLKTIQNSTVLAIPSDSVVEFIQNQRDGSDAYIKAIDYCNMMIARAVLVPDLMGMSGSKTSGGSFALGETQFGTFQKTVESNRSAIARLITLKIIKPLIAANFGEDIDAEFKFSPFTKEDESKYVEIWANAVKGNIYKPNDDEINHFRQVLKFPEGPVEIREPAPIPAFPGGNNNLPPGKEKPFMRGFIQKERTPYEKKVDFAQVESDLESFEKKYVSKLTAAGRRIWTDFIDQVRDRTIVDRFKPDILNEIVPKYQKDMNLLFKQAFRELFKRSYNEAQKEVNPSAPEKFQSEPFLPEEFIALLDAEAFTAVGDYTTGITKKLRGITLQGIKAGQTSSEITALLRDAGNTESERWIETVMRTKTTEIYNQARKSYWETDEIAKEIVTAYQFSAVLDERTTECCEELHGNIYEKGEYIDGVTPPLHFNCRSILVPITKFEDYKTAGEIGYEKLKAMGAGLLNV